MENAKVNLVEFENRWYKPGGSIVSRTFWFIINGLVFNSYFFPINSLKVIILRLFGSKLGKGVVIKPKVNIKYPWNLEIGDNVWIGENVWIDNLAKVVISSNSCLSQGAMLLTGNHNYKASTFNLVIGPIHIEEGVWIGAKSVVCPGIKCGSHSILSVGSVASADLLPYKIYQGNPAEFKRERIIKK